MKQFKSEYDKITYYFTSVEQKRKFDNNPKKYLPQYGGYCAFGVYIDKKLRADPNKFIVKDGKYFLYLNNIELDAKQLWQAENNHYGMVKASDKKWDKLKKTYN